MTFQQLLEDADNMLSAIQKFESTAQAVGSAVPVLGPALSVATGATAAAKGVVHGVVSGLQFIPPHGQTQTAAGGTQSQ